MTVRSVLRACADDLLDTEPSVTVDQIVTCAYRNHPDVFAEHADRMMMQSARTLVASMMRELVEDDDDQLVLTGLGLPSAICVQAANGTYYVRSDKATWVELCAGRGLRSDNVEAAQRKLDRYDQAVDALRAVMESDHSCTVAEAVARIAALDSRPSVLNQGEPA